MISNNKQVLIIAFFFPPVEKVGGRRWAKFSKYLHRKGYNVKVLSTSYPNKNNCPWINDVLFLKDEVVRMKLPQRYFFHRVMQPKTVLGKIFYRISNIYYNKEKLKKGNYKDISSDLERQIIKNAKFLIKKYNIKNVIVTGGPFHICYFTAKLKKKFPDLNLIVDLRDFWADGDEYNTLSAKRQFEEKAMEEFTFHQADHIITSAERIEMRIKEVYPIFAPKVLHIPHAYDEDEFEGVTQKVNSFPDTIKMIYAGSLYPNMEESIYLLIDFLKKISLQGKQVVLDFYTFDKNYYHLFEKADLLNVVNYLPPIKPSDLFKKMREYDLVSILKTVAVASEHSKSSKFYELIAIRKPVIYFGRMGDISEFIENNKLGFSIHELNSIDAKVSLVLNNMLEQTLPDVNFDFQQYSFERVTQQLENILVY